MGQHYVHFDTQRYDGLQGLKPPSPNRESDSYNLTVTAAMGSGRLWLLYLVIIILFVCYSERAPTPMSNMAKTQEKTAKRKQPHQEGGQAAKRPKKDGSKRPSKPQAKPAPKLLSK